MLQLRGRIERRYWEPNGFFLIVKSINKYVFMSIINIEMMIWMRYKMNPYDMIGDLTLQDTMFYIKTLTNRLEEEAKNQTQDKLMKSLIAIRDILNYMTFSKTSNN